jgi:hypothetical protein
MKCPFAPLGYAVMAHVKPKNQQIWDAHAETGFNMGMVMEHHQCFHIYIVKTKATRVSKTVFFKHQYITNPQVTPMTLIIKVVSELTSALKGTVSLNGKTAEVLEIFSKLFAKIAMEKAAMAKTKEQRNNLRTHPNARRAVPLPRVVNRPPIPASPLPRVPIVPTEPDCHIRDSGKRGQTVGTASRVAVLPTKIVKSQSQVQTIENVTPRQGTHGPPIARPNYIMQDKDEDEPYY